MADITLKQARELLGISQLEVDRRAGLVKGTTHDLEAGRSKSPSHDTVTRIVRVLREAGLVTVSGEQLFPVSDEAKAS